MTSTLNDKNLENVTQQVKSTTILDPAKHLSVAPPRDENVMIIDGLLNQNQGQDGLLWVARPCVPGPL